MATVPVCAQQPRQRETSQWQGRADGGQPFPQQRQDQLQQDVQSPMSRHHGRLSPEERKQLRHDINEAGRELYRPPSPQRPPP